MRTFLVLLTPLFTIHTALADGVPAADNDHPQQVTQSSNASFDHRLPPILPGETVHGGNGKKLRVITTAGGVHVKDAPAPNSPGSQGSSNVAPKDVSVIVDQRHDRPHERTLGSFNNSRE